ncbi:type VI secretion system domain-containing protein [Candidatus Poribacteria bacterium]
MPEVLEDIAKPISDSEPSGEDIAKLTPTPENEGWIKNYGDLRGLINAVASNSDSIVALSQDILAQKSKDLRIAGHLCMGLMHRDGFTGLAEALKGYRLLLEEYWDKGLYPSRDAARATNVKSLDGRLAKDIAAQTGDKGYFVPASPTDAEAIEEIKETAEAIGNILTEKVPQRAVVMDQLSRAVTARLQALGPAAKKAEPPAETEQPESRGRVASLLRRDAPTAAAEAPAAAIEAEEEAAIGRIESEIEALRAVVQAAGFLFKKDHRSAAPYRLLRSSLWYSLPLFNPEPNASGKRVTQYSPPANKPQLEQLLQDENWESLVTQCETAFTAGFESGGGGCFCLDIQRFLSIALKELARKAGEEGDDRAKEAYEAVDKVILQETAILVGRYPWITDILYSNETPFADGQTKSWVEKTVIPAMGSGADQGAAALGGAASDDSKVSEDFEEAQDLLSRQKWGDAVDLMQNGINAEPTLKGRFQRRLNLASLCLDAGQPTMARPLLEQLDEDIGRFSLDQWEPGLSVQVWNHLSRCYQELLSQDGQQENGNTYREKADKVFEKICRLDIRAALTGSK